MYVFTKEVDTEKTFIPEAEIWELLEKTKNLIEKKFRNSR